MSDRSSYIDLEIEDGIATLVLNRPEKLNAWSWESARQISARADELRFNDDVRVVVVRAEGRAFCAGVDLGMPEDRITGRSPAEKVRNYYERFRWIHERFHVFSQLPQPVIMAIHGFCLGAGLEVATALDAAGVPLIEVTHGDGLGGASVNYGFPAATDCSRPRVLGRSSAGRQERCAAGGLVFSRHTSELGRVHGRPRTRRLAQRTADHCETRGYSPGR